MISDEFLIVRTDGDWFDFRPEEYESVLRPKSFSSSPTKPDFGHYTINTDGLRLSFTFEEPGIQVVVEDGNIEEDQIHRIMIEILENIEQTTGQKGKIFVL